MAKALGVGDDAACALAPHPWYGAHDETLNAVAGPNY